MTTAPPPTAGPGRPAKDLVRDILGNMKAQGLDTGEALDKLAKTASATGTRLTGVPHVKTAPAPAPVAAPRPSMSSRDKAITRPNGELYYVRKMGPHDDVEVLREARNQKMPILLTSGPGTGKSAMFEAAFMDIGFELVLGTGDTEVSDFIGTYVPLPGGGFQWIDGPLVRAMEEGWPLLVDEIALIDPRVMSVVYSVMDGRGLLPITSNPERGTVVAETGFVVFGATNPRAPGARMSEALMSRFAIHIEVGIDYALVRRMGVPSNIVTVAQNIKKKYDSNELSWFPAIRELLAFRDIAAVFGEEVALSNMVSQAPDIDQPQVTDIMTRGYGRAIKGLEIK
jgi:nitric oxide reductase NorQ protein